MNQLVLKSYNPKFRLKYFIILISIEVTNHHGTQD
jgi:hypothetical protein